MEADIKTKFQYLSCFANHNAISGGLYVGFHRRVEVDILHQELVLKKSVVHRETTLVTRLSQCQIIHCKVAGHELVIANICTYPNIPINDRISFWTEVGEEIAKMECPDIICCGDFNSVLDPAKDTLSTAPCFSAPYFKQFIETMEWVDS